MAGSNRVDFCDRGAPDACVSRRLFRVQTLFARSHGGEEEQRGSRQTFFRLDVLFSGALSTGNFHGDIARPFCTRDTESMFHY